MGVTTPFVAGPQTNCAAVCGAIGQKDSSQEQFHMASNVALMLEERILGRTGRRVQDLKIECDENCITLRGKTESYHVKQLALSAIREALPSFKITNGIEVMA
jgi:hypothetical protein